jgi:hypothetical protein
MKWWTAIDRARIRVESGCADETVKKYPNVRDASRRRIERACMVLDLPLPPVAVEKTA